MTGWRNQATHQEETKAVKAELVRLGYKDAKVGHGTGTAWAWLHIQVSVPKARACRCTDEPIGKCLECRHLSNEHYQRAISIAKRVTGRDGQYDGEINATVNLM